MGSLRSKSAFVLTCALLLGSDNSFAAENAIHGVALSEQGNEITATVLSDAPLGQQIKATKTGPYYNIIIPNAKVTPNASCNSTPLAQSCRINSTPASDGGSYVKIQVKVPTGVKVWAQSSTELSSFFPEKSEFSEEYEQELLSDLEADQSFDEEFSEDELSFESEEDKSSFEEEIPDFEATKTITTPTNPVARPKSVLINEDNGPSDTLLYGSSIWILVIILLSVLIYLAARDKVRQQMGDMDIDLSEPQKKKPAEEEKKTAAKSKKAKQVPKPRYESIDLNDYAPKSFAPAEPEVSSYSIENEPYIDIDSLYVKQTPITYDTPAAKEEDITLHFEDITEEPSPTTVVDVIDDSNNTTTEDDDIDDFLASFADKDDDEETDEDSTSSTELPLETELAPEEAPTETNDSNNEKENVLSFTLSDFEEEEEEENNTLPEQDIEDIEDFEFSDSKDSYTEDTETVDDTEILSVEDLLEGELIEDDSLSKNLQSELESDNDIDEILNNPVEDLLDDVLATEGLEFSDADVEFIQKQLQVDITPELLDEFRHSSQQAQPQNTEPIMTLEKFDEANPNLSDATINELLKENIKFNSVDTKVIHDLMTSFEISEESVTDARIRKEQEDQANIDYYQNETDFAFTLVKTDENSANNILVLDENYYPDLENVDFSGDAILSEFTLIAPEKPNYTDELDLSPRLTLEDLLGETESVVSEATYDAVDSNDENFVELEETTPEVSHFMEEMDSTSNTLNIEEIEEQFKALGLDLSDKTPSTTENTELEANSIDLPDSIELNETTEELALSNYTGAEETTNFESTDFSSSDAEILAKCPVDATTSLYIAKYEDKNVLVGAKNDTIKPLYELPKETPTSNISVRMTETTEDKTRYIVRINKFKSVIEVSEEDIELVLVL